ncbi:MAG: Uma2 family endonuclease [Fimbriimonadales bacterium]|nr:Uma2 family endonuclease [Fimbriimonadales bacterium]
MATQASAPAKPKRARRAKTRAERMPNLDELSRSLEFLQSLELPVGDGDRMEADWHAVNISLLDEVVRLHLGEPTSYYCAGNMFLYYSVSQALEIKEYVEGEGKKPRYKGPDFFLVKDVDGTRMRESWRVWEEDGRYPDLIVEFISSSTRRKDVEQNVKIYEKVFHTGEYFWYDGRKGELKGYRLDRGRYAPIEPNEQGWLWSDALGAYLGVWRGVYRGRRYNWLRLYDREGRLVPTGQERAEQERQRAEQAEAELQRLREALRERGIELE